MTHERTYWLNLFSAKTWQEFLAMGGTVTGFRDGRWATVQRINEGDYFLCYLTGVSRFVGILEAVEKPYKGEEVIWQDEAFPCRVPVKPIVTLTVETGVPIIALRDELSIFRDASEHPFSWTGHVRGSPTKYSTTDGEAIVRAVEYAARNPVVHPTDTIVPSQPTEPAQAAGTQPDPDGDESPRPERKEISEHDEIQWLLLKFGNDRGLDVWVARNDRGREVRADDSRICRVSGSDYRSSSRRRCSRSSN